METPFYRVPGHQLTAPAENFFLEQSSGAKDNFDDASKGPFILLWGGVEECHVKIV